MDELHEVNELYRRAAYAIIERGVERGELRAGAPSQLVINVMYGTFVIYRMMAPWDEREGMLPDPDALVEQVVDFVMEGLSPWVIRGADA